MAEFSLSFSPESIAEIARFATFPVLLSNEVQSAMQQGGDLLVPAIRGAMNWQNPTGALEESIHPITDSPYEIQIGSDLPYARRRNWGFSGQADSLGRYYANDPGMYFMENGMQSQQQAVLQLIDAAVNRALAKLGSG
jgi:hypothetical protein